MSHDELWEEETPPAECYSEISGTVDEYLHRVAEGLFLPIDFYSATEWNALRRELRRNEHGV